MTINQYKELPGYGRPVFIRKGDAFECSVYARWGAVFITIPPDMSRKQAVKRALECAKQADAHYQRFGWKGAAVGEGKA